MIKSDYFLKKIFFIYIILIILILSYMKLKLTTILFLIIFSLTAPIRVLKIPTISDLLFRFILYIFISKISFLIFLLNISSYYILTYIVEKDIQLKMAYEHIINALNTTGKIIFKKMNINPKFGGSAITILAGLYIGNEVSVDFQHKSIETERNGLLSTLQGNKTVFEISEPGTDGWLDAKTKIININNELEDLRVKDQQVVGVVEKKVYEGVETLKGLGADD